MESKKKTGIELIAEERQRQVEKEGWTAEHDSEHSNEEIAQSAACYAMPSNHLEYDNGGFFGENRIDGFKTPLLWPWHSSWWKPTPKNRIRQLQKAGALIAAEIDRLQNLNPTKQ